MLTRSFSTDATVEGRTLTGIAAYWDRASNVTDNGRDFYLEAFANTAADKTLKERGSKPFPLGFLHPWSSSAGTDKRPLGSVSFSRSNEGLVFNAVLSRTQAADEMLELVKDGAVTDVSIGFNSYKHKVQDKVLIRTEIGLRELSLAPTGLGQHQGAEVLAVRSLEATKSRLETERRLAQLRLWSPYK